MLVGLLVPSAIAEELPEVRRVAGMDAVATALAVSAEAFVQADVAVLASSAQAPDAAVAAPLAAVHGGPLLLTLPDRLRPDLRDELRRLNVTEVILVGGVDAIVPQVEEALREDLGIEVERVAGRTRFHTAAEVAVLVAEVNDADIVPFLARGEDPVAVDAAAVAGWAGFSGQPILFAHSDEIPAPTWDGLADVDARGVRIVGGPAAIAADVEDQLVERGYPIRARAGGATRYATSAEIARLHAEEFQTNADVNEHRGTLLASGRSWRDAAAAASAVAGTSRTLLLLDPQDLAASLPSQRRLAMQCRPMTIVGGPAAIDPAVEEQLRVVAASCPFPEHGASPADLGGTQVELDVYAWVDTQPAPEPNMSACSGFHVSGRVSRTDGGSSTDLRFETMWVRFDDGRVWNAPTLEVETRDRATRATGRCGPLRQTNRSVDVAVRICRAHDCAPLAVRNVRIEVVS